MKKNSIYLFFIIILGFYGFLLASPQEEQKLIQQLKNKDEELQLMAIEMLGLKRIKAAVPPLINLLESKELRREQKVEIIYALGNIGDPQAILSILRSFDEISFYNKFYPIEGSLKKMDPNWRERPEVQEFFDEVAEKFQHADCQNCKRCNLLDTMVFLDPKRSTRWCLDSVVRQDDCCLRLAIITLGKQKEHKAIGPLINLFRYETAIFSPDLLSQALNKIDRNWRTHHMTKKIVQEILAEYTTHVKRGEQPHFLRRVLVELATPQVTSFFVQLLKDQRLPNEVRIEAARSLGELGDPKASTSLIETLQREENFFEKDDSSFGIHETCLQALGKIGDKRAIPYLRNVLKNPKNTDSRYMTLSAVKELGAAEFIPDLLELVSNEIEQCPTDHILEVLSIIGNPGVALELFDLVDEKITQKGFKPTYQFHQYLYTILELTDIQGAERLLYYLDNFDSFLAIHRKIREYKDVNNEAREIIIKLEKDMNYKTNRSLKIEIIQTLGKLKYKEALGTIKRYVMDSDIHIRTYAEWAVYYISH